MPNVAGQVVFMDARDGGKGNEQLTFSFIEKDDNSAKFVSNKMAALDTFRRTLEIYHRALVRLSEPSFAEGLGRTLDLFGVYDIEGDHSFPNIELEDLWESYSEDVGEAWKEVGGVIQYSLDEAKRDLSRAGSRC